MIKGKKPGAGSGVRATGARQSWAAKGRRRDRAATASGSACEPPPRPVAAAPGAPASPPPYLPCPI